jgi:hypothetical protein
MTKIDTVQAARGPVEDSRAFVRLDAGKLTARGKKRHAEKADGY